MQAKSGIVPHAFTWRDAKSNYGCCVVVDVVGVVVEIGCVVVYMYICISKCSRSYYIRDTWTGTGPFWEPSRT